MKVVLEQIKDGAEEVVIRYHEMNDQIQDLIEYIDRQDRTVMAYFDGQQSIIKLKDIIYFESVDGVTYVYTKDQVHRLNLSLAAIEAGYPQEGYFRCSKAMIINIYHIEKLKSEPGNRIDALMDNGEHVIISRRFAKNLRNLLKGQN